MCYGILVCVCKCVCVRHAPCKHQIIYSFLRYGVPKKLLSDQGREFVNHINFALAETFGVERMVTSGYHPQTNGLTER